MKTILLTGAAGFIGYQTALKLLEKGYRVIGVDNLNRYYAPILKTYRLKLLKTYRSFVFLKKEISRKNGLKDVFKKHRIDSVINLAARAGVRYSMKNPFVYESTNTAGTLNLLELMKDHNVKKMVLASTSSLYAGLKMPFTEELAVNTPISPYAATKKGAEALCYTYHHLYGIDVSVVRYFTVFGPAGRPDMSPFRFIKWVMEGTPITLYGDGSQSRDFTYVTDIAEGTVKAEEHRSGYEIFNLGGGNNPVSMKYIISLVEKYTGRKAMVNQKPEHKADMKSTWADISKAEKYLSWRPEISVEDGFERTVKWHEENRALCRNIDEFMIEGKRDA